MSTTSQYLVFVFNGLIAGGTLVLAGMGKVTWTEAALFIGTLLTPSAAHVAIQRAQL